MTLTDTTAYTASNTIALSYNGHGNTDHQISQDVSVLYPTADTDYRITRATIPAGSKFQIGAHWHEEYDEYMKVLKGRGKIRLGNEWKVYTAEDGDVKIPRNVVHDICRADKDAKPGEEDGEDFVWEEWTEPSMFVFSVVLSLAFPLLSSNVWGAVLIETDADDGSKELFFRHAFSSVADKEVFGWKLPLQQLLVLMACDTYIAMVPGPAGWYATHGLYALLRPITSLLGLKPFHDEYTPSRLVDIRREMESGRKVKRT